MLNKKDNLIIFVLCLIVISLGVLVVIKNPADVRIVKNTNISIDKNVNINQNINQTVNQNINQQIATTTNEIDTSDWLTYRNEECGFEVKYPNKWEIESNDKIIIYKRQTNILKTEFGSLDIEIKKINLKKFIEEYNTSDILNGHPLSFIIHQDDYMLDNVMATKLVGTTAIGVDKNFIFVTNNINNNYVISFYDFNEYHLGIISTFKFIE